MIRDKMQNKIKDTFKHRKERHIFTHHIEQEEIEPVNFDYDFCNLTMH